MDLTHMTKAIIPKPAVIIEKLQDEGKDRNLQHIALLEVISTWLQGGAQCEAATQPHIQSLNRDLILRLLHHKGHTRLINSIRIPLILVTSK